MSPGQIERYAQERSVTLVSNLYGKPLADAYADAYAAIGRQRMPPDYGIVTTGRGKLLQESIQNFLIALVLSIAFIYIVLPAPFAIIAGMLPVALGRGDGSASRASLATVVVGGQALSLLVTLVVTPVIYSMFDDLSGLRVFSRGRFPRLRRRAAVAGARPEPAPRDLARQGGAA